MRKSRNSSLSRISEQRASIKVKYNDAQTNRVARHEKLIEMIQRYTRTIDEEQRLRRMRKNTVMEIDIRYRSSKQNKNYHFPRQVSVDSDEEESPRNFTRNIYYDLHSQNQLIREPSQSQFLQMSRRVKSLDQVSGGIKSEKFLKKIGKLERLQTDLDNGQNGEQIGSKIKRAKTISKESSSSHVVLPVLGKKVQNLKTEGIQSGINKLKIQKMMMKKLVTEAYNPIEQSPLRGYDRKSHLRHK